MPFTQPLLVLSAWVPLSHALTASYFATCLKGLEPILAAELASPLIGAQKVVEGRLGVEFSGPPSVGARAVLWRAGGRVPAPREDVRRLRKGGPPPRKVPPREPPQVSAPRAPRHPAAPRLALGLRLSVCSCVRVRGPEKRKHFFPGFTLVVCSGQAAAQVTGDLKYRDTRGPAPGVCSTPFKVIYLLVSCHST